MSDSAAIPQRGNRQPTQVAHGRATESVNDEKQCEFYGTMATWTNTPQTAGRWKGSTMRPLTLYGIPNCDTVKRARVWLVAQGLPHQFHDFKKHGVPEAALRGWAQALGWQPLLNRQGTTWRKLTPEVQASVVDADSALALLQAHSSVIKRPVVAWRNGAVTVGFDAVQWATLAADVP